jgi:uncharacterized iron-regulated membrane protein
MVACVTGGLLVYKHRLDTIVDRNLWQVSGNGEARAMSELLQQVNNNAADQTLLSVRLPESEREAAVFSMAGSDGRTTEYFVDPHTGRLLGQRLADRAMVSRILALHYQLLADIPGQWLMLVLTFVMLISVITGLVLWGGWKNLRSGFRIRNKGGHNLLLHYDLHKVIGAATGLVLLVCISTGGLIDALHLARHQSEAESAHPAEQANRQTSTEGVNLDQLIGSAKTALPGGIPERIDFPETTRGSAEVVMRFQEQRTAGISLSKVVLNTANGTVERTEKHLRPPTEYAGLMVLASLHFGRFAGHTSKVLYIVCGFASIGLLITGLLVAFPSTVRGSIHPQ